jgi:short-subunit dehydrogenase
MKSLDGLTAVVTGASSGIGTAFALALAREGVQLRLTGRDESRLREIAASCRRDSPDARYYPADLAIDSDTETLLQALLRDCDGVDILIHCAGQVCSGPVATAPVAEFDQQYRTNLRAPYVLTQALLPKLLACRGQVVFINSSVGLAARADVSQYAATKHGLRAIADALRAEVNAQGVRVLSVYVGRTATPAQERIHAAEGRQYAAARLLQPDDVVAAVLSALKAEPTAEITDINIRPMQKS